MTCGRAQRASNRIYIPKGQKDLQVKASQFCKEYQKSHSHHIYLLPLQDCQEEKQPVQKGADMTVFSFKFSFGYFFPNELLNIIQMGEGRLFCQKRGETSISYPDTCEIEAWHFPCKSRLPHPDQSAQMSVFGAKVLPCGLTISSGPLTWWPIRSPKCSKDRSPTSRILLQEAPPVFTSGVNPHILTTHYTVGIFLV